MYQNLPLPYGGFQKLGYPNCWMVYDGKSIDMDDLGVTPPFSETPILYIYKEEE